MSIIVDLIVIGIITLFIFIGYKQGLVKSAIKILSFFIAFIVALILYKPVAHVIITSTPLGDNIKASIVNSVQLPEGITINDEVDIETETQFTIPNMIVEKSRDTVNNVAEMIMVKIIETGTLIVIFVIVRVGLRFVTVLTDLITKLPVLKQFDKAGGVMYGILKGTMTVLVIFALMFLFSPVIGENTIDAINRSWIAGTIYNNNILLKII